MEFWQNVLNIKLYNRILKYLPAGYYQVTLSAFPDTQCRRVDYAKMGGKKSVSFGKGISFLKKLVKIFPVKEFPILSANKSLQEAILKTTGLLFLVIYRFLSMAAAEELSFEADRRQRLEI